MIAGAPRFNRKANEDFTRQLRKRVNSYFEDNHIRRTGDVRVFIKTIVMFTIYFTPYVMTLIFPMNPIEYILSYVVMGIGIAGIGLGVMHDACHGSVSKRPWVNRMLGYSLNVIGGNALNWRVQHNVLHHSFTNVHGVDEDLEGGHIMRFTPKEPWKKHHKLQHIYSWFLYSLMTVSWVFLKDFKRLKNYDEQGLLEGQGAKYGEAVIILAISKLIYFAYMFAIPLYLGYNWMLVIGAFFLMHMVGGLLLAMIFQPAHVMEHNEFYEGDEGMIDSSYEAHQLRTTANFAPTNRILTWFCGGLNYQVEHHIFPMISHVHYPKISKIVEATAKEYGLPYHSAKSFREALSIHQRTMKKLGQPDMKVA